MAKLSSHTNTTYTITHKTMMSLRVNALQNNFLKSACMQCLLFHIQGLFQTQTFLDFLTLSKLIVLQTILTDLLSLNTK